MSALNLRRADGVEAALRRGVSLWRRKGMALQLHAAPPPPSQARYIAFHADAGDAQHGWDGLIGCDEWLGNVAPELAALANFEGAAEHAMQLFAATPQPITATFPYRTMAVTGLVSGADLQQSPLAALSAPQATVWLRAVPSLPPPQTKNDVLEIDQKLHHIPASLQFLLGASQLSRGCLSRVAPGDVLLVTEHALRMRCNALVLGWYSITEEGITVDELLNEPYEEAAEAALQASPEQAGEDVIEDEQAARAVAGIARIPVRLEFVLQQNKLTMGELSQMYSGQVIALAPEAEKQVLVLANGAVLGRGELVQMDDRLGVEIIDLYGSGDDAH